MPKYWQGRVAYCEGPGRGLGEIGSSCLVRRGRSDDGRLEGHHVDQGGDQVDPNPNVTFHFTPIGSSWLNQIEIWFGIITRQSIRRGTFASVTVLIAKIRTYIDAWNADAKPFTWTATAGEILAKVRLVQTNIKQLVDNNAK